MSDITTTAKAEAVRLYTAAGYTLFPLKSRGELSKAKEPAKKGWQQTPFGMSADDLPDMFGVILGENDCVLDYDPRRGEGQLAELCKSTGITPVESCIVESASGGYHVYFKCPPGFSFPATVPGYPAIEIKTIGRFVVGSGSKFKDQAYSFARLNPLTVLDLPESLLLACKPRDKSEKAPSLPDSAFDDSQANQARYIQYLLLPIHDQGSSYAIACEGRAYGLSPDVIRKLFMQYLNVRWDNPIGDEELRGKIEHAFAHGQSATGALTPANDFAGFDTDSLKEEIKYDFKWNYHVDKSTGCRMAAPTLNNGVNYFNLKALSNPDEPNPLYNLIAFNEFSSQIEFLKPAPWHKTTNHLAWDDVDTAQLKMFLARRCHVDFHKTDLLDIILIAAHQKDYHPVRTWLNTLQWDGEPRVDQWLPTYAGTADTEYATAIGKNTLIAAVARIYDPGCQHDSMLVLEGNQGTGKTSLCRILGGKWFCETTLNLHRVADTVATIQGAWIVELPEMEFTRHAEVKQLKAFLTCKADKVRMPYARFPVTLERKGIFIGTTNPDPSGYLRDQTGNRRFWPIWTSKIDLDSLARDRDQLFAEAKYRYQKGESAYIDRQELIDVANGEALKRVTTDIWEDIIVEWVEGQEETHFTIQQIAEQCLNMMPSKMTRDTKIRVSQAMRNIGYEWKSVRHNGNATKAFKKPDRSLAELFE